MASPKTLLLLLFTALSTVEITAADDWPFWRGKNRNGVTSEISGWDESTRKWNLTSAWKARVGEGSSSPLIVGSRIYTMGWNDGSDTLYCLDAETGKTIWSKSYPCPRYGRQATGDQGIYSGPSSTPEYDPTTEWIYTLSTDGDLQCFDTSQDGKRIWKKNLYDEFEIPRRPRVGRSGRRDYGFTSSPLVHKSWLIVEVGAKEGTVMAFDKKSGRVVWRSEVHAPAGHNGGPVRIDVEGVPCVAVHHHDGLLVLRLDPGNEGKSIGSYPWQTSFANNIATPTVLKDSILITSAYNHQKIARLQVTLAGITRIWEQDHASKVCSPVIVDGSVYWAWRKVTCLDFETGKLRWQGGRVGDQGSVIATGDKRLIVWTNRGDLLLIETATRSKEFRQLSSKRVLSRTDAWPHVVLSKGRLLCKDRDGELRCFLVQKPGTSADRDK